jgi:hypothetical protein
VLRTLLFSCSVLFLVQKERVQERHTDKETFRLKPAFDRVFLSLSKTAG